MSAFSIQNGSIATDASQLVSGLTLHLPEKRTSVVLGPAGTGKSVLLTQLAGQYLPPGWTRTGDWQTHASSHIKLVDQARHGDLRRNPAEQERALRDAFASSADVLLLDEPTRGVSDSFKAEIHDLLDKEHSRRTIVLVTHDLTLARTVGDYVCLLCAGKLEAAGSVKEFFENPPTALCKRFLEQGNCWPAPSAPQLPPHFHWLEESKLAGMGRPGLLGSVDQDLEAIALAGVNLLISLTIQPAPRAALRSVGIEGRHLPIQDMGIPGVGPLLRMLNGIKRAIGAGSGVAVHCDAGLGRTGTVLAAHYILAGDSAGTAIKRVREVNPLYIQARAQLDFLERFAEDMHG